MLIFKLLVVAISVGNVVKVNLRQMFCLGNWSGGEAGLEWCLNIRCFVRILLN